MEQGERGDQCLIEGDPDIDDCHPGLYCIRSADGVYRTPLPTFTEAVNVECALIDRIDSMRRTGDDFDMPEESDTEVFEAIEAVSIPVPETEEAPEIELEDSPSFEGVRRSVIKTGKDSLIRHEEFVHRRRRRSWKDTAKAACQFQRHPRRIKVQDLPETACQNASA